MSKVRSLRRCVLAALCLVVTAGSGVVPVDALPASAYGSNDVITNLPFGAHSHWMEPWRGYQDTPSASTFVDGLGMNFNLTGQDPDLMMHMLASHGIRHARIEIGWGDLSYDETQFTNAAALRAELAAAKKYGVRPLILLNSNHGLPCPTQLSVRTVLVGASAGATSLQLDDVSGIRVGFSGLSNMTQFWAAEVLITGVSGTTVMLSKPLLTNVPAGSRVALATLKYRPFSVPGSTEYQATMNGWLSYVDKVVAFTSDALGTTSAADKGFDLEIWNELTFGSNFLNINAYYATPQYQYDPTSIWHDLVVQTAAHLDANPSAVSGVKVGDGFANTTPWIGASIEPARISAISKHPYPPRLSFPIQDQTTTVNLNALGQVDRYVPTYTARFPEYFATGIQTETMVRDMGPVTTTVAGIGHGRNARTSNGTPLPITTWMTEMNLSPHDMYSWITAEAALALKAKITARTAAFFLNKGVSQLDFFGATGGDTDVGMIKDNFVAYAVPGAPYPTNDATYTSPALAVLQRMSSRMSNQLDRSLTSTRSVQVTSVTDTHNHSIFAGDGSAAHPPLYDRDALTVLPYQANAHQFVIPYYVMTRDVLQPLAPEQFSVQLQGINGSTAQVTGYDPINDVLVPVNVLSQTSTTITLQVTATDYPYVLTIQD